MKNKVIKILCLLMFFSFSAMPLNASKDILRTIEESFGLQTIGECKIHISRYTNGNSFDIDEIMNIAKKAYLRSVSRKWKSNADNTAFVISSENKFEIIFVWKRTKLKLIMEFEYDDDNKILFVTEKCSSDSSRYNLIPQFKDEFIRLVQVEIGGAIDTSVNVNVNVYQSVWIHR